MEPRAFCLLVKWIYSQSIPLELDIVDVPSFDEESEYVAPAEVREAWEAQDLDLAQLWITTDRLLILWLQNEVMVAFHQLWDDDSTHRACTSSWLSYAYAHTSEGSPLRKLAVDQFVYSTEVKDLLDQLAADFPRDMLLEIFAPCAKALEPIVEGDKEYKKKRQGVHKDGKIVTKEYQYRFTREWRSYMVAEDL